MWLSHHWTNSASLSRLGMGLIYAKARRKETAKAAVPLPILGASRRPTRVNAHASRGSLT
jgi:hypothetical protein